MSDSETCRIRSLCEIPLRDYFAGEAINGILSSGDSLRALHHLAEEQEENSADVTAKFAYSIADAMIEQRQGNAGETGAGSEQVRVTGISTIQKNRLGDELKELAKEANKRVNHDFLRERRAYGRGMRRVIAEIQDVLDEEG